MIVNMNWGMDLEGSCQDTGLLTLNQYMLGTTLVVLGMLLPWLILPHMPAHLCLGWYWQKLDRMVPPMEEFKTNFESEIFYRLLKSVQAAHEWWLTEHLKYIQRLMDYQ